MLNPYIKSFQIFNCPSASTVAPYTGGYSSTLSYGMSYSPAYYASSAGASTVGITDGGCTSNCGVNVGQPNIGLAAIDDVAGTIFLTDSSYYLVTVGDNATGPYPYAQDRHLETLNCLFLDGHVKSLRKSTIFGPTKAQWHYWTTSDD